LTVIIVSCLSKFIIVSILYMCSSLFQLYLNNTVKISTTKALELSLET
jgi:hypothetical protein